MPQPIDAVITWVDGNDPKLKQKQRQYFQTDENDSTSSSERFYDSNEIYYCIAGILKNAPFINRIFIVTDDQTPQAITNIRSHFGNDAASRIQIVDHTEIFEGYAQHLPTFNSIAIGTALHRIRGLSDRAVYFNDDVVLVNPAKEEDFFWGNKPVIRGSWTKNRTIELRTALRKKQTKYRRWRVLPNKFSSKEIQKNAHQLIGGTDTFFCHDHTAHSFYKPTIIDFYAQNPHFLDRNLSFRIREQSQFGSIALTNALELRAGHAIIAAARLSYLKADKKFFQGVYVRRKKRSFKKNNNLFVCIQSLSKTKFKARKAIFAWLDELLFS